MLLLNARVEELRTHQVLKHGMSRGLVLTQANQWQLITPSGTAPTPRYGHSMAWSDAAGGFYIFGGTDGSLDAGAKRNKRSSIVIWR